MARTHRSLYRFELWNATDGRIADLSALCTKRAFTLKLNRAETLDLEFKLRVIEDFAAKIDLTPAELLQPGVNDIRVYRGNKAIFGTRVRYISSSISEETETLSLHASGYLDDLGHRYLLPVAGVNGGVTTYTATDIGAIMWDMIDTTQNLTNGDMGFTQGDIQTSRALTDTWQPYATSLKDIFIAITERDNAVDFGFTYDRKLNVYYPSMGRVQTDFAFTYPGNIVALSAPLDATQLVNVSINRGSGNGLDITPIETRNAAPSQLVYGRMERIDDYADVSVPATLDSFGDETLRIFSLPLIIPDVTLRSGKEPPLGAYSLGDWVKFNIPGRPAFANVHNTHQRIQEIAVSLNDMDTEEIRLTVANR